MSDRLARVLTGVAVLAVAVIAAAVSYAHIESLALGHGQPVAAARLLPLSVDGLIVAASFTLLTEARAHRPAPGLARAGLVLGVVATVLANVAYGARYGVVGEIISGWPAAAFLTATEILLGQIRRARGRGIPTRTEVAGTVADNVPRGMPSAVPGNVPVVERVPVPEPVSVEVVPPTPATVPRTVPSGRARGRAPMTKARAPERVFADEIQQGQLPSLREIKARARCGTPRAQTIRDELAAILQGTPEAA